MRKGKFRHSGIAALKKIPIIVGCLVFLFSILSPFCHSVPFTIPEMRATEYYWSFKVDIYANHLGGHHISRQYWFIDYWFDSYSGSWSFLSLTWVLISIFVAQILTLMAGVTPILSNREVLALAPMALCSAVMVLMMNFCQELSGNTDSTYYEKGYWFTCLSLLVFLIAFITNLAVRKKQKKNP